MKERLISKLQIVTLSYKTFCFFSIKLEEEEQQRRRRRSSGLEAIICFSSGHGNQVLARLVQRLNEELDEATSMRQDAEASHETEIAAECKAAEDDLRVHRIFFSLHPMLSLPNTELLSVCTRCHM